MSDLLTLGRAGPPDVKALVGLIHACFAELARLDPPSGAAGETMETIGGLLARGAVIKAEQGGALVGCVAAERRAGGLYIGRLSVRPDRRRRGIAQALLAAVEAYAREIGAGHVVLNVRLVLDGNIRLFERAGYRIVGQGSHPGFGSPTYHIMEKRLDSAT
ncbi:GNAT family N-acetyltransferase [Dongia sp.]|uniref:GNAT family N-acetyltransferase n=1 Tax=Dongia sp. TaxID=1977262 RepID=UPI0035AE2A64